MLQLISNYIRDENGATVIEYGLIAGLLSITIAGVLGDVATNLVSRFELVNSYFE